MHSRDSHAARGRYLRHHGRRGSIVVLAAVFVVVIFAFTAFTVDTGWLVLTKGQLQNAADAASKGAAWELVDGTGMAGTITPSEAATAAQTAAATVAAANQAGEKTSVYLNGARDTRLGQYVWNAQTGVYDKLWGVSPYNMVEVTLHRDQGAGAGGGDESLPLFFAPVIGHETANLSVTSTSALFAGVGFKITPGSNQMVSILPIALDIDTWDNLINNNIGTDSYTYDENSGGSNPGGDGILEVNLYPEGTTALPPGNRGTVDLGSPNNSTADLSRQILYGLNEYDLSFFPDGEIRTDNGPLLIDGDTGLSAGIKDELTAIIGRPVAIPIFTSVVGPGNNAVYTVTKFVPVRIMYVKLTGSPSHKKVMIQPAPFGDSTVIIGDQTTVTTESYFTTSRLIQ